jgi:CMP-2-keto-3-deoxyoctulosonic acid synthetase
MKVLVVEDHGIGVDTPEDAVRAEAALRAAGLA